jgi:hypothetical protein
MKRQKEEEEEGGGEEAPSELLGSFLALVGTICVGFGAHLLPVLFVQQLQQRGRLKPTPLIME